MVTLPSGVDTVCGVVAIRENDGGPDWLDFYLPLGALARADRRVGGYPFEAPGTSSLAWRRPIDDWLALIGAAVYAAVAYRLALIGHEVSGDTYAKDLQDDPPRPRRIGYLIPGDGGVRYVASDL